jgi:hypothetical protein
MGPDDFNQQFQQTEHTGHIILTLFFVFFGLIVVAGIVTTIWRVRATRSLAKSAGLDPDSAAAVALTDPTATSAMIIASRMGQQGGQPAGHDAASRLKELDGLKAQGLITDQEYADKRAAILNGL